MVLHRPVELAPVFGELFLRGTNIVQKVEARHFSFLFGKLFHFRRQLDRLSGNHEIASPEMMNCPRMFH
jgi:hypothetical protein